MITNQQGDHMKKHLFVAVLILPVLIFSGCKDKDSQTIKKFTELKTPSEKLGYALGSDIGKSFKKNEMDIDQGAFIQGFQDGMTENPSPLLTPEQTKEIQQSAIMDMRKKLTEKRQLAADKNKKDGETFLAENAKKPGIKTTASGLQYEVLTDGTGAIPKDTDRVQVNYSGKLLDGTEFDSSYQRGTPATFAVKGVIPGWTEALLLMKAGSKWRIFVPSELAYKEHGAGQKIGPNATLIFEIELLGIGDPAAAADGAAVAPEASTNPAMGGNPAMGTKPAMGTNPAVGAKPAEAVKPAVAPAPAAPKKP